MLSSVSSISSFSSSFSSSSSSSSSSSDKFWNVLLNRAFEEGEDCFKKEQFVRDFSSSEARRNHLNTRLPALLLVDVVSRRTDDPNTVILADGSMINSSQFPDNTDEQKLLQALISLKNSFTKFNIDTVKDNIIFSNNTSNNNNNNVEHQLALKLIQLANVISQNPIWRQLFISNITLLESIYGNQNNNNNNNDNNNNNNVNNSDQIMEQIKESFLNRAFVMADDYLREKIISNDDVDGMEPYVLIGIPALTIYEGLKRSLSSSSQGIQLAVGVTVTEANCPNSFRPFMPRLINLTRQLATLKIIPTTSENNNNNNNDNNNINGGGEENYLKIAILRPPSFVLKDDQRSKDLDKFASLLRGVAVDLTQMSEFRTAFGNVLLLLAAS